MPYIGNQPSESFTSFATQEFSTSATTSYTLDHAVTNENEIALFINNVRQQPGSGKAYTATGTALTLSAATASTDTMYCVFLGRALQTVTPATNSITAAMVGNDLISGKDALTSSAATTDEFLISDAGTLKRIDAQFFQNTPAFMAKMSADQTISSSTLTKVQYDSEIFDTHSAYDPSTNYRFTPGVAGTYFLFAQVHGKSNANSELEDFRIAIVKNGTQIFSTKHNPATNDANQIALNIQCLELADADDYFEVKAFIDDASGNPTIESDDGGGVTSYFGGYKLIGI